MSIAADWNELPPATRRRLIGIGIGRVLATTVALVALYYLLPIDHNKNVPVVLIAGLLILAAFTAWQLRIVRKNRYLAVRAVEALATALPLFLLLFAWALLHDGAHQSGQLQHAPSFPHRYALLRGHRLQHRGIR